MPHINTKKILTVILLTLLFLLSGCNYNEKVNVIFFDKSDYRISFYSKGEDRDIENNYLNAILDLKISHPEVINEVKVKETTRNGLRDKNIEEYPSLHISQNGETIKVFSGEQKKEEIVKNIETLILQSKQTVSLSSQ